MAYYQGNVQGNSLREYVPHYVVKSDFLPTRIVEGNSAQTTELVIDF